MSAGSDPDLFWALCGGGGECALGTAVEFGPHPAPELYGGRLLWPGDRAPQVMEAFRRTTAGARDELTVWWNLVRPPGGDPLVAVDATYLGGEDKGRELLRPLEDAGAPLSDSRGVLPLTEPVAPLLSVQARHLGGALARPSRSGAWPPRSPPRQRP